MVNFAVRELAAKAKGGEHAVGVVRFQDCTCSVNGLHVLVRGGGAAIVERGGNVGLAIRGREVHRHHEANLAPTAEIVQEGVGANGLELVDFDLTRVLVILLAGLLRIYEGELLLSLELLGGGFKAPNEIVTAVGIPVEALEGELLLEVVGTEVKP